AEQAEVTAEKAAPKKKAATKTKKEDAVVAEQAEVTEEKAVPKKKAATKSKKEDVAETEAAPAAEVTPEAEPKMKPAAKSKKEASAEVEVAFDPEVSKADLKEPAEPAAASEVKSDETAPADSKEETLAQAAAPETKAEAEELVEDDEDYPDNDDEEDDEVQDEYSEDEEDEASADEAVDKKAADRPLPVKKYRQLQVVQGKVLEVIEAQPERKIGNRVLRAKEERVLIELEDGQQGFLFRKDTADIADDQDLFDLFIEGDNITCVIKKIYPDGGKFIFSTVLLKMRNDLSKFQDVIKNHGIFTAKVIRKLSVGYLLKHNEFSCLLPISQVVVPEEERGNLIGQDIEVAPIRIDYGRIRLIVSQNVANAIIKRREKEAFISHIEVGQEFDGVVKNIESYGAFVDVGNGVEGLLHISELDHVRVSKVEKVLNPGDTVRVKVIKIDGIHIGLSRKALLPNYWLEYAEKHEVGSVVTGKITEINNYGVVVDLNEDVSAFLPRSEFAWEKDVYISDSAAVDDEIEMKIIEVDPIKRRIILSRKQLTPNPWEKLTCRPGDTINVEVVKELKDGYKISCQGAVGYLPKASIANYHEEISIGTELRVKVRVFDPKRTKLVVNLRAETERHPRNSFRQHQKTQDKLTNTFGDLLKSQLKDPKE
ncbi:MAG: S1 RNA-binding domain-containing protein, partial [Bacilli bacterium]|nr:S1 RNA-binding domain-containing protein [Bacilli bacterium]